MNEELDQMHQSQEYYINIDFIRLGVEFTARFPTTGLRQLKRCDVKIEKDIKEFKEPAVSEQWSEEPYNVKTTAKETVSTS